MGEKVQLKGGICEVNFVYNVKKGVYANSSSDIPKLTEIRPPLIHSTSVSLAGQITTEEDGLWISFLS